MIGTETLAGAVRAAYEAEIAAMSVDTPVRAAITVRRNAAQAFGDYTESPLDKILWDVVWDPHVDECRPQATECADGSVIERQLGITGCDTEGGIVHVATTGHYWEHRDEPEGYSVITMDLNVGVTERWRPVRLRRSAEVINRMMFHKIELILSESPRPESTDGQGGGLARAVIYKKGSERVGSILAFAGMGQKLHQLTPLYKLTDNLAALEQKYGTEFLYGQAPRSEEVVYGLGSVAAVTMSV